MFQSARQIWVWPNSSAPIALPCPRRVSICQADLGLAELSSSVAHLATFTVSICQADLGLAERVAAGAAIVYGKYVSICQADLGLAELSHIWPAKLNDGFQSARQIWVWPN